MEVEIITPQRDSWHLMHSGAYLAFFKQITISDHTTQGSLKACMPAEPAALKVYLFT